MQELRKSLTLTEIGVIVSLAISVGGVIFTGGVVYGQVRANTQRIDKIEPKVDDISKRIERIDANVEFLREHAARQLNR